MKLLYIAEDYGLPTNVVTKRLAFLGTTGSGKSYGAMKLAEEMIGAGIQTIILDPVGIHWGLRLSADKKGAGIPINVFGGLYGDIPITANSGAIIADVIIDKKISAVIDVSQFEFDTDKAKFASAFAQRFFFRKKAAPSPVMIFLEEAQEFIPQNPEKSENLMLHHFVRMCKIGRNFGIGISMISQRPQELNKKALNLSQCVFAFQTSGHHERKAIDEWIKDKGLTLDIAQDLPKLKIGEPHVWSPGWLGISQRIKISKRTTFHPSEEDTISYEPEKLNKLSPVDIAKLSESIKETVEKAKENDPELLKKRIAQLEKEKRTIPQPVVDIAELNKLKEENSHIRVSLKEAVKMNEESLAIIRKIERKIKEKLPLITQIATQIMEDDLLFGIDTTELRLKEFKEKIAGNKVNSLLFGDSSKPTRFLGFKNERNIVQIRPGPRTQPPTSKPKSNNSLGADDTQLGKGERIVLIAIAQHEEGVDREQLTVLTGYKRSSRDQYLQRLSQKGYWEANNSGMIVITQEGADALGSDYSPLPTGSELREYWFNRLSGGERTIFEVAIEVYPNTISRDEITDKTNYKRSSRDQYIQRLAQRKLLYSLSGGMIKASDKLF